MSSCARAYLFRFHKSSTYVALTMLLAWICSSMAHSQRIPLGDDVARPVEGAGHDYIHALAETVNPANGTVNLKLALPTPLGRGLSMPFAVSYNSGQVHYFGSNFPGCGSLDSGQCAGGSGLNNSRNGWSDTLPYAVVPSERVPLYPSQSNSWCTVSTSYNFYDPTGVGHSLGIAYISGVQGSGTYQNQNACNSIYYSPTSCFTSPTGFNGCSGGYQYTAVSQGGDSQVQSSFAPCSATGSTEGNCGTGYPAFTVTDLHGTVYTFNAATGGIQYPYTIEDRNGNIISFSSCGGGCTASDGSVPSTVVKDTLGNSVVIINYPNATPQNNGQVSSYVVDGLTFTPSYGTTSANFDATQQAVQVALPPQNWTCAAYFKVNESALTEITSLALPKGQQPNGQQYTFHYDSTWGLINEVDYPNGGWVRYTWKLSDNDNQLASFSAFNPSAQNGYQDAQPYVGGCNYQYQTPVVATRQVGYSPGSAAAQTQEFAYQTNWDTQDARIWDTKVTTVKTTDNITGKVQTTTYTYSPVYQAPQPNTQGQLNPQLSVEKSIVTQDWNGAVLKTENQAWGDPFLMASDQTVLPNGQSSQVVYTYVNHSFPPLPIEKDDYDYGPTPVLSRKTLYSYYEYDLPNQMVTEDAQGNRLAETDAYYDGQTALGAASTAVPVAAGVSMLPSYKVNGTSFFTHDETNYGPSSTLPRGNPTTITRWLNTGGSVTTTHTYDETGQVLTTTDGCGNMSCSDMSGKSHTTTYTYADSPSTGNANGNSNAYLTQITDPLGHTQKFSWSYATGELASSTDPNGQSTSFHYNDPLLRLTETDYPTGGGTTTVAYADPTPSNPITPSITTTKTASPDPSLINVAQMDGMGHVTQTQLTSATPQTIYEDTVYDGMGNVLSQSTPYYSKGDPSYGVSTLTYDALGRKVLQTNADASSQEWCYNGVASTQSNNCSPNARTSSAASWTDFSDERGVHWQQQIDGLGRLVSVIEPDQNTGALKTETDYTYDVLDNLQSVIQNGNSSLNDSLMPETARSRSFTYDSLSRLITAQNPESGITCYGTWSGGAVNSGTCQNGYDANGNLVSKTDANNVLITYGYDATNRLTSKSSGRYNAVSDVVGANLSYDSSGSNNYGIGRLTGQANDGVAGESYVYDSMGRVVNTSWHQYQPAGTVQGMHVTYDLAGKPTQIVYPDGRTITQVWDGAGRLSSITDAQSGANYFSAPSGSAQQYFPSGALENALLGTAITESLGLNNRLQPTTVTANTTLLASSSTGANLYNRQVFYAANTSSSPCAAQATNDNGNVYSIVDNLVAGNSQVFAYDGLNRLNCASRADNAYNHNYRMDSFGNMGVVDNIQGDMGDSVDPATNRLKTHGGSLGYDAVGSLVSVPNPLGGSHTFGYTAEGYLRCYDRCNVGSYLYDGIGQRTYASRPTSATSYVYLNGQPMAEYNNTGFWTDYIYANGQKIAKITSGTSATSSGSGAASSGSTVGGNVLHLSGSTAANSGSVSSGVQLTTLNGITIQSGDVIHLSQFTVGENGAAGGIWIGFTDGNFSTSYKPAGPLYDSDGQMSNLDGITGQWHQRMIDVSQFQGETVNNFILLNERNGSTGQFDFYFANVALHRADGTILPLWVGNPAASSFSTTVYGPGQSTANVDMALPAGVDSSQQGTHFYLADRLGTTQIELSAEGWPLSQGEFTPYGQEITHGSTLNAFGPQPADGSSMHFKFTGKERESDTGFDYFGARYYSSVIGRFSSPDWSAKPEAVPYSSLDNPQSLNLYTYVGNSPLSRVDADGHCSPPAVGKGQIGVCIDLYIQAKTINVIGQGDGRGPAANDPSATYRVELQLITDPKAGTVSLVKDDAGVSSALGGLFSSKGTDATSPITPTTDANGTTHFTINNTALNGLHDLPGAPQNTIKTTINMEVTSGGKVGIEGGVRTAYPSMEIYSYKPSGQSTTILQMQEHRPSDLSKQNQQIPQVAPL